MKHQYNTPTNMVKTKFLFKHLVLSILQVDNKICTIHEITHILQFCYNQLAYHASKNSTV